MSRPLADHSQQLGMIDRLGQEIIHAGRHAAPLIFGERRRTERDDGPARQPPLIFPRADQAGCLQTVHDRPLVMAFSASRPFSAMSTAKPCLWSIALTTLRFTRLSSTTKTRPLGPGDAGSGKASWILARGA